MEFGVCYMVEIPDMNQVIANNIASWLREQNKCLGDLADWIGVSIRDVQGVLNASRTASAIELGMIADYLGIPIDVLVQLPKEPLCKYRILSFIGKLDSDSKNALAVADKLSDLCLYHAKVRENGIRVLQPFED